MTRYLFILMLVSILAAGCGKSREEKMAEKAIESQTGGNADVNLDKQQMSIETKDGEKMQIASGEEGLKVPADFPKDIFVYPGAKVDASFKSKDSVQLHLSTADAFAKVIERYQAELKKNGWEEKTATQTAESAMVEYTKDTRTVIVNASIEGKQTKIIIMMNKDEDQHV